MSAQKKRKMLPNGRNDGRGSFVSLPHRVLDSAAYNSLAQTPRALLVALARRFNGHNNGSLYLSVEDAMAMTGLTDHRSATRAFNALQEVGLIVMTKDSFFSVKTNDSNRARCWMLTWQPAFDRPAGMDFLDYEPAPGTKERKRMERAFRAMKAYRRQRDAGKLPVVNTPTKPITRSVSVDRPVVEITSGKTMICGNPPKTPTVETTLHKHLPYQSDDRAVLEDAS